ncbi:hypothetical protein DFH11DRAFT_685789 [Phellopilus nigrolimitatus]|nr:hypothetical protein DFH11DRAFT_685789 [Phellopilus nigrolimitatus]
MYSTVLCSGQAACEPDVHEFVEHYSFRIVSALFTGCVVWSSLCHLRWPLLLYVVQRVWLRWSLMWTAMYRKRDVRTGRSDPKSQHMSIEKDKDHVKDEDLTNENGTMRTSMNESIFRRGDNPALIFALTLLFFMSSLSQFTSLLPISSSEQPLCAFLVAWDTISFQSARLVGLVVVGRSVRSPRLKCSEIVAFSITLVLITGLVVVTSALGVGFSKSSSDPRVALTFCYHKHVLVPALILSLLAISLELSCIFRLFYIVSPPSASLQRRLGILVRDIRFVKAISLLVYDVVIIGPSAIETIYLGDSLPFSIVALIVLAAFNRPSPAPSAEWDVENPTCPSEHTLQTPTRSPDCHVIRIHEHPFSAAALHNNAIQPDIWCSPQYPGFTATSGSQGHQLQDAFVANVQAIAPEQDGPEIHSGLKTKPSVANIRTRSLSKSKSRSSTQTHATRASSRWRLSFMHADSHEHILSPRPAIHAANTHKRTASAPPIPLPSTAAVLSSRLSRNSVAGSTAQTIQSVYGSDILRPEPGRIMRDKMKMAENVLEKQSRNAPSLSGASNMSLAHSRSTRWNSWSSDQTVDMQYICDPRNVRQGLVSPAFCGPVTH